MLEGTWPENDIRRAFVAGANKEEKKSYSKIYYENHKEKKKAMAKAWYEANLERAKKWRKHHYEANSDKAKADAQAWRDANREKAKANSKAYRENNYETIMTKVKLGREANPEKYSKTNREHRSKQRALKRTTQIEPINEKQVFIRDGWACQICHKRVNKKFKYPNPMCASLDHIIPLSQGGTHTYNNIQLAHLVCNVSKQDNVLPQGERLRIF